MSTNETESQVGATYPYAPLSTAFVIAEAVKQLGGSKMPVPKSQLAAALKESEKSQGFTFKIAATRCFGLIDGKSSFSLTENAKRYYFPTSQSDKIEASLSFLQSPYSFAEIIKRFDGTQLPELQMLANIFHTQLRVPESWSLRAAQFFIRSAQLVGAVDESGFLRFNASKYTASASLKSELTSVHPIALPQQPDPGKRATEVAVSDEFSDSKGAHVYVLPLANGRKVSIKAPLDITSQEIKRLQKWVEFTLQVNWGGENEGANKL